MMINFHRLLIFSPSNFQELKNAEEVLNKWNITIFENRQECIWLDRMDTDKRQEYEDILTEVTGKK